MILKPFVTGCPEQSQNDFKSIAGVPSDPKRKQDWQHRNSIPSAHGVVSSIRFDWASFAAPNIF